MKKIILFLVAVMIITTLLSWTGILKPKQGSLLGGSIYNPPREVILFGSRTATTTVSGFPFVISEMALNTSTLASATSTVLSGIEAFDTLDLNLSVRPSSTESSFKLSIFQSEDGGYWYPYNTSTVATIKDATTTITYAPANTATKTISLKLPDLNTKFLKITLVRNGYEGGFIYADGLLGDQN
jgi:hypothetical protein